MLHLQGDLQSVFDVLYDLGVIEPVLGMDWKSGLEEISGGSAGLMRAIRVVNSCGADRITLRSELSKLDRRSLEILAMEVAREYAGYQTRQELH